jgi:hypothetical protein
MTHCEAYLKFASGLVEGYVKLVNEGNCGLAMSTNGRRDIPQTSRCVFFTVDKFRTLVVPNSFRHKHVCLVYSVMSILYLLQFKRHPLFICQ